MAELVRLVKLVVDRGGPPISFQCRYGSANSSLPRSREGKEDSIASPFLSAPCSRKSWSSTTCLYLAVDGKSDISHDTLQLALSFSLSLMSFLALWFHPSQHSINGVDRPSRPRARLGERRISRQRADWRKRGGRFNLCAVIAVPALRGTFGEKELSSWLRGMHNF